MPRSAPRPLAPCARSLDLALAFVLLAAPAALAQPSPPAVAGSWGTTYGDMVLSVDGETVSGTYTHDGGSRLEGTLRDGVLEGTWYEPRSARRCSEARGGTYYWGRLRFEFSEPGRFEGRWNHCDGELTRSWTGERAGPPETAPPGGGTVRPVPPPGPDRPSDAEPCTWAPLPNDVWTTAAGVPTGLLETFRAIKRAGAPIQTAALTPAGEWVVVAGNVPCYSDGFPAGVRQHVDRYIASGRQIDVVAFGPDGGWVVLAEDWMRRSGVPDPLADRVRQDVAAGLRVRSFAFVPPATSAAPGGFAYVTDDGRVTTAGAVPRAFEEAAEAAAVGERPVHEVAFDGDGNWALVAGDWFVTEGVPLGLFQALDRYRTDEDRRIDRVVLDPRRGGDRWAITSNGGEPAPTSGPGLVERGMGPGASIWARMKALDVRGLAVAVVQGNRLAWARGYGLRHPEPPAGAQRYVLPTTVFDAASVSKPVAAVGALRLMGSETDLTRERVLDDLSGTVVPRDVMPGLRRLLDPYDGITLARLLSHCAGLDHQNGRSGAEPFEPGEAQPSLTEMIFGWDPASDTKRAARLPGVAPGDSMRYSGVNYLLVQALIEANTDPAVGFDGYMRGLLDTLGMASSTFDTPPPDRTAYTQGYDPGPPCNGTCTVEGYPNKAAASLTSTVLDLARFVVMLNQGGVLRQDQGADCGAPSCQILDAEGVDRLLRRDGGGGPALVERQCTDPSNGRFGLGMRVSDPGGPREVFWHRGTHNGFRAYIYGFPQVDAGLAILMTADGNDTDAADSSATTLAKELEARLVDAYGWPTYSN